MKLKLKVTGIIPKISGIEIPNAIISDYRLEFYKNQYMKLSMVLFGINDTNTPHLKTIEWTITKNPILPVFEKDSLGNDTNIVLSTGHPGMQVILDGISIDSTGIVITSQVVKDWILAQRDFDGNLISDNWEFIV